MPAEEQAGQLRHDRQEGDKDESDAEEGTAIQRPEPDGFEDVLYKIIKNAADVYEGEPAHFDRDEEKQQAARFRHQRRDREEHRQVQIERRDTVGNVEQEIHQHRIDIHGQDADQIIQVHAQRAPELLQIAGGPIGAVEREGDTENGVDAHIADPGERENIAEEPPDLPVSNGLRVEGQRAVQAQRCPELGKKIDQRVADADPQHEIRNSLIPVVVQKPMVGIVEFAQSDPSFITAIVA